MESGAARRGMRVLCPIHTPDPVPPPDEAVPSEAGLSEETAAPTQRHRGCQGNEVFDTAIARDLAGCAYAAYHCVRGDPTCSDVDVAGTTTAYLDRDYFLRTAGAALEVEVLSARNIDDKLGIFSKGSVHAVVRLGKSTFKTRAVRAAPTVAWEQTGYLFVRKPVPEQLEVVVELFGTDDPGWRSFPITTVTFPLTADLRDGASHELRPAAGNDAPGVSLRLLWRQAEDIAARAVLSVDLKESDARPALPPFGLLPPVPAGQNFDWAALLTECGALVAEQYDLIAFLDNKRTNTQAWVLRAKQSRALVVSFRGTDPRQIKTLSNLALVPVTPAIGSTIAQVDGIARVAKAGEEEFNLTQSALNDAKAAGTTAVKSAARAGKRIADWVESKYLGGAPSPEALNPPLPPMPENDPWVHGGFYWAYDSLRGPLLEAVGTLMCDGGAEPWHVFVTGHAMGAGHATLFAYELACCSYVDVPVPAVSSYTFGSPRVGNALFAAAYNAAVPDTWRVTNSKDYVPTVPKLLGYTHVDHHVLLDGKVTYSILAAVGAAWGGAVAAVKGRFGKKTAPVEAAGPTDSAAPGDAAVPASDAAAAAAASADGGPAAKALAAETAAAQPEGVTAEQLMAAEAGGADSEWTEVHSAEAGPAEPATAGDAHAPAIEPVHLEEGAEGMEVVSATQQLTLEDDDAAGTAGLEEHSAPLYLENLAFLVSGAASRVTTIP